MAIAGTETHIVNRENRLLQKKLKEQELAEQG